MIKPNPPAAPPPLTPRTPSARVIPPILLAIGSLGTVAAVAAVGLVSGALTGGCVHPDEQMQDYLTRSQTLRDEYKKEATDASAVTDAGAFSGTYLLRCLSPLVAGDTDRTLRFKATINFVPIAPGEGTIFVKLQPLKVGALNASDPSGPIFPDAPRDQAKVTGGKFAFDLGDSPDLSKDSNPLTGVDWGISKLVFRGSFTSPPKELCANLEGTTRPSGLDAKGTSCLFTQVSSETETVPHQPAAAFTCPD